MSERHRDEDQHADRHRHEGERGAGGPTEEDEPAMPYMTSDDPSPYLVESQIDMLGRFASRSRGDARHGGDGRRARRARVAVVLMVLVLVVIVAGVLVPLVGRLL